VGQEILALRTATSKYYVDVVIQATGPTGGTIPTWPGNVGQTTTDGGITWMNQGATTLSALTGWTANHNYPARSRIIDSNGAVEVSPAGGMSGPGPGAPMWATTAGATTTDNAVTWTNAGMLPRVSGIIIDNTVAPGTLAGASELYFSTLGNENCPIAPVSGCAVQASQSKLK
jgi:hypothetical protein